METRLETAPEYILPEPQGLMSAKTYKHRIVDPFVKKLKVLVKTVLARCFAGWDNYHRLNTTNWQLYQENDRLSKANEKLTADNEVLRAENKDYKLLRKVLGKQLDALVAQAKEIKQSKKRELRFGNNKDER